MNALMQGIEFGRGISQRRGQSGAARALLAGDPYAAEQAYMTVDMPEQALEAFPSPDLMTAGNGPTVMDPVLCRVTIAMLLFMMTRLCLVR